MRTPHLFFRVFLLSTLMLALVSSATARDRAAARRVTIHPRTEAGTPLTTKVGTPLRLSARLELEDGTSIPLDAHVTWAASDPSVLRFGGTGGHLPGTATPLRKGVAAVTIVYPPVSGAAVPYPSDRMLGDAVTVVVQEP